MPSVVYIAVLPVSCNQCFTEKYRISLCLLHPEVIDITEVWFCVSCVADLPVSIIIIDCFPGYYTDSTGNLCPGSRQERKKSARHYCSLQKQACLPLLIREQTLMNKLLGTMLDQKLEIALCFLFSNLTS